MNTIQEAELLPPSNAVAVREQNMAVGRAMSLDELHENLEFIRNVMRREMVEGQDYGKVPGCGDKPCLLQPGAQKLCMTFQLMNEVKEEKVVDFPNMHREYAMTIRLKSATGRTWEGVGTCSTMEAKYRFRGGARKCPKCGKESIIKGKKEYGGGWLCYQKKGGCGEKWPDGDAAIEGQSVERVEHDNPPDFWNTVRKMAFKRALVHAAINATNTSELWTQDVEEMAQNAEAGAPAHAPAATKPAPAPAPKPVPSGPPPAAKPNGTATAAHRERMVKLLAGNEAGARDVATEFMQKLSWLMPNEALEDLPLQFAPVSKDEMDKLVFSIQMFAGGEAAVKPYEAHAMPLAPKPAVKPAAPAKPIEVPRDEEPWRSFPMPFGKHAGVKLADLDKKYLFGMWANHQVETEYNGRPRREDQISKDQLLRDMLDKAGEHYEFTTPADDPG